MARNSVRLKDHWAEQRTVRPARDRVVDRASCCCLGALFTRLFYLQVVRHDYFSDLSQGNRIRIEPIPPPRGLILDRNGDAARTEPPGLPARTDPRADAGRRRHAGASW